MANLNTLPREILHAIISYVSPEHVPPLFADLLSCSVICKSVSSAAQSALYRSIDLNRSEEADEEADEKTDRRQSRFLQTIAENSRLGGMIREFENKKDSSYHEHPDASMNPDADPEVLRAAGQNMTGLVKALLMPNDLAAGIVKNLTDYSQLVDLSLHGFLPSQHTWKIAPVALKTLNWIMATGPQVPNPPPLWDGVSQVIDIAEATCPALESLNISLQSNVWNPNWWQKTEVGPEITQFYAQTKRAGRGNLTKLRHFGFRYKYDNDGNGILDRAFTEFIKRYSHTLSSVEIPVPCGEWTRETLDHIMKVCMLVPTLKNLSLSQTNHSSPGTHLQPDAALAELTTKLSAPEFAIESLFIEDTHCSFSAVVGEMFQGWTSLKRLHLGGADMNHTPYGDDGRPCFDDYRPEILGFIKALPQSLEELKIELNGEGLWCDDDSDFDPMADMGQDIFHTLRRLRCCDIHAWISNMDGGLGPIPEKAVMHRRLPESSGDYVSIGNSKKVLWTSRLDCIYQGEEEDPTSLTQQPLSLDGEDQFEGPDADEIWLDGYQFETEDYSWPFYVDAFRLDRAGFRDRHG